MVSRWVVKWPAAVPCFARCMRARLSHRHDVANFVVLGVNERRCVLGVELARRLHEFLQHRRVEHIAVFVLDLGGARRADVEDLFPCVRVPDHRGPLDRRGCPVDLGPDFADGPVHVAWANLDVAPRVVGAECPADRVLLSGGQRLPNLGEIDEVGSAVVSGHRQWQHHGKREWLRHEHVIDVPECAGLRNALALLGGRDKDLRVILVMIMRLVVGNDFSDEFPEFDELLRRWVYVFQNNELVRVNDLADLSSGICCPDFAGSSPVTCAPSPLPFTLSVIDSLLLFGRG